LTSDHVKELTEEVEKLAKENVGEVRRKERDRLAIRSIRGQGEERENVCIHVLERKRDDVCDI
jgi:hypothetical protein